MKWGLGKTHLSSAAQEMAQVWTAQNNFPSSRVVYSPRCRKWRTRLNSLRCQHGWGVGT